MTEQKQTAVEWLFQVIPFRLFLTEQGIAVNSQTVETRNHDHPNPPPPPIHRPAG